MPGALQVRNLDDETTARLKRRAALKGLSTEELHRQILKEALSNEIEPNFLELAADLRALMEGTKQTPSEVLLREGRDER